MTSVDITTALALRVCSLEALHSQITCIDMYRPMGVRLFKSLSPLCSPYGSVMFVCLFLRAGGGGDGGENWRGIILLP